MPIKEQTMLHLKRQKERIQMVDHHPPVAKEKMMNNIIPNDIEDSVARTSSAGNVDKTLSSASR